MKRFKFFTSLLLISLTLALVPLVSSAASIKKGKLTLCVDNWEGLTNADGTGSYSELVKKVFEEKYKVSIRLYPWARAQGAFKEKKCDGLIAENKPSDFAIRPRIILDDLPLEAYYLKGKVDFKGEETLRSKKIAWIRGYGYDKITPIKMNFTEVNDIKSAFKMLEAGRFDILIDYAYTFKDECHLAGIDCTKITSTPSGISEKAYVVFHNNENGIELAHYWDRRMTDLIVEGEPQRIFQKYGQRYVGKP